MHPFHSSNATNKQDMELQQNPSNTSENKSLDTTNVSCKIPTLKRRRRLVVIALDWYDNMGAPDKKMLQVIREIFKAVRLDPQASSYTGFAISTAMSASEKIDFLKSGEIHETEFDAFICASGSQIYYPDANGSLNIDTDYSSHIDYRWGCDGLKKTMGKLLSNREDGGQDNCCVKEDTKTSNSHCISYFIEDPSTAMKVDELRQKFRMRGLRCHPMYCRNSTRMQAIPLMASRSQALRYLFVRWNLNVSSMIVFLGETGDTDYEELISGNHKTIIIKDMVGKGSEELLRTSGNLLREDIIPEGSPNVAHTNEDPKADVIANIMSQLFKRGNRI